MKRHRKFAKTIFVVLLICIFLGAFFIPFRTALVFYDGTTHQLAAYLPIKKGESFHIIWKHSIHLTDVIEKYKITENNAIKQDEIVYEHFGIGMPSYALEGEKFTYENGKYHIKNLNNVFPAINIRNGKTISKHRLVWGWNGEHMIWLNQYFPPGSWYEMKAEKLSLWKTLKGVKIHE